MGGRIGSIDQFQGKKAYSATFFGRIGSIGAE